MLKNTFFVLFFLPEDKVLQRLEELKYFPKPFHTCRQPLPLVQRYEIPQELIEGKEKKIEKKQKMGGEVKVRFSGLQATMMPVESKIRKEGRNEEG